MLVATPPVAAGSHAWTQAVVSAGIHHAGRSDATAYTPPGAQAREAAGGRITAVQASRDYYGHLRVQTSVCWNGIDRCVPMTGASLRTQAFNGLDADKPIYLVHTVLGKGPLPAPLFVKGNVIVWYER